MTTQNPGPFGDAIARLVATAVHHVIVSVLPHWNAERTRAQVDHMRSAASDMHLQVGPLARHCLDTGAVHPVLEPVLRLLAKGE